MPTKHSDSSVRLKPDEERRRKKIDEVFGSNDENIESFLSNAQNATQAFLEQLAEQIKLPISRFIHSQPSSTRQEREQLVSKLNLILASLGLAVECPKTRLPSTLANSRDEAGAALAFKPFGKAGMTRATLNDLGHLNFVPAPFIIEGGKTEHLSDTCLSDKIERATVGDSIGEEGRQQDVWSKTMPDDKKDVVKIVSAGDAMAHWIASQISIEGRRGETDPGRIARQALQNQIEFITKLNKVESSTESPRPSGNGRSR